MHVSGQHILDSYIAAINRGYDRFWCIPAAPKDSQYVAFLLAKQSKNQPILQESIEMAQDIASKYDININYKIIREDMIETDKTKHYVAHHGKWRSRGYLFDCKQKKCANEIHSVLNNFILQKISKPLHCINICRLVLPEFGEHYIKTYVSPQNPSWIKKQIAGPKYAYQASKFGKPQIFSMNTNLIIYIDDIEEVAFLDPNNCLIDISNPSMFNNNNTMKLLRSCKGCDAWHGLQGSFCSVACFNKALKINNYDAKTEKYEIALKLVGLEGVKDVILSFILYSREYYHDIDVLMQLKIPFILKNNKLKACEGCDKLHGHSAGLCAVCFKRIQNIDNFDVIKEKYEIALKWTELQCIKDVIISFIVYPREYYHDCLNESDELMMQKQSVYDDWYKYSEKNGKLKKSINIIKKMILKQNIVEFIGLLIELQAWMTCKQIWEITQCLPSVDENMHDNDSDNARKIIALMYFGMKFFENDGEYIENIKIFLMNNYKNMVNISMNGNHTQLFKIFNFDKGPYWRLLGRHSYKNHISHNIVRESVDDILLWASKPPIVDEQTLLMMTSGW